MKAASKDIQKSEFKIFYKGNYLVAQWLEFGAFTLGPGFDPWPKTKTLRNMKQGQKKKKNFHKQLIEAFSLSMIAAVVSGVKEIQFGCSPLQEVS